MTDNMFEGKMYYLCPYCKRYTIEKRASDYGDNCEWMFCIICKRSWPIPKEEENEHGSERT